MSDGPLHWHRVGALGNHVRWFRGGLELATPGDCHQSSVAIDDVSLYAADLETANGEPFIGAARTEWRVERDGATGLRYPILTPGVFSASETPPNGLYGAVAAAAGRGGRLGHLGGASVLVLGGTVDMVLAPYPSGLEFIATVSRQVAGDVLEVSPDCASLAQCHDETTARQKSRLLDEAAVFWGAWADPAEMGGLSPPSLYNPTRTSVPTCSLEDAFDPTAAVSGHGPLTADRDFIVFQGQEQCDVNTTRHWARAAPTPTATPHDPLPSPDAPATVLQDATEAFDVVLSNGAFGARANGYDLAVMTPAGFARWPKEAVRIAGYISQEKAQEEVMLLLGGCLGILLKYLDVILCV